MRKQIKTYSTTLLLVFSFYHLEAQVKDTVTLPGIFDLLQDKGLKEITVKTDLSYLVTNKKTADEYIEGVFKFEPSKDVTMTLPVKVKCRGRYRRMKCEFPPLKLKFKKDDLAAHKLNEFNEIKLVTHCMGEKERSRDLILRECLGYNLFNILSPNSLRAQLVKVDYINTKGRPKKIKGWGILIEDSDELAYRMKGSKYQRMGVPLDSFNVQQEQITALFNFMIGNTDWSRVMARNIELINTEEGIKIVPYDFDFSGMVDASYAVPNAELGQQSTKDRCYLGQPCQPEDIAQVVALFLNKKGELISAIEGEKMLSSASKIEIKNYLTSFFEIIEDKELLSQALSGKVIKALDKEEEK